MVRMSLETLAAEDYVNQQKTIQQFTKVKKVLANVRMLLRAAAVSS